MEIKRLSENKIRCALTETEIQEMGFDIDEIVGNSEMTQKFMRVVLNLVEEQENINLENISPMVKAELLQDHSMAITFGGDSDLTFKNLVDTVNHLMNDMSPEKLEEFHQMTKEERQNALDAILGDCQKKDGKKQMRKEHQEEAVEEPAPKPSGKKKSRDMVCALRFQEMEDLITMSKVCFDGRLPKSRLYKMEDGYYLILDFTGFSKTEMRPFAFGTMEFDDGHYSEVGQIAHIEEQGTCIVKIDALQTLMQL